MADPNTVCKSIYDCLFDWQSIFGTVIGGMISLVVAKVVANSAQRTEDATSAFIVIGELVSFSQMVNEVKTQADKETEQDRKEFRIAELFHLQRPRVSNQFDYACTRIMRHSKLLAAALTQINLHIRNSDPILNRCAEDITMLQKYKSFETRDVNMILADIRAAMISMNRIVELSNCTIYLVEELIVRRKSLFKWRLKYFHNDKQALAYKIIMAEVSHTPPPPFPTL